ncbi:hypothetical protein Tco_0209164 [Tanacetum coccineum]
MLKYPSPLAVIDANVPVDDKFHSMVKVPSLLDEYSSVSMVGTFNGIVILVLVDMLLRSHMILYNPLTRASKTLDVMDPHPPSRVFTLPHRYGFDTNDLKIIRFVDQPDLRFKCDVYDLNTSSWSKSPHYLKREFFIWGDGGDGIFEHNSTIHGHHYKEMIPIHYKEMISRYKPINDYQGFLLRFLNGRKPCSLITMGSERQYNSLVSNKFHPMCILDKGVILLRSMGSHQLVTYDKSKDSYKNFKDLACLDDFEDKATMHCNRFRIHPVEYVESLV